MTERRLVGRSGANRWARLSNILSPQFQGFPFGEKGVIKNGIELPSQLKNTSVYQPCTFVSSTDVFQPSFSDQGFTKDRNDNNGGYIHRICGSTRGAASTVDSYINLQFRKMESPTNPLLSYLLNPRAHYFHLCHISILSTCSTLPVLPLPSPSLLSVSLFSTLSLCALTDRNTSVVVSLTLASPLPIQIVKEARETAVELNAREGHMVDVSDPDILARGGCFFGGHRLAAVCDLPHRVCASSLMVTATVYLTRYGGHGLGRSEKHSGL